MTSGHISSCYSRGIDGWGFRAHEKDTDKITGFFCLYYILDILWKAFHKMSGSAKGVTAAKTRGRKYIRNRGYGGSVRTSSQASVKSIFKQLSQSWHNLENAQILAWNAAANTAQGKSILGSKSKISGANLYMRLNYWIVFCGGTAVTNPPALTGVEAPASAALIVTAKAMTFTLSAIPKSIENIKLILCATEGMSNGITKAYSKAAAFMPPQTPVTTAIDLKASYDAKYGEPTAATPKIFFKYFYVNTTTGEKSREVLLEGKFTPEAMAAAEGETEGEE